MKESHTPSSTERQRESQFEGLSDEGVEAMLHVRSLFKMPRWNSNDDKSNQIPFQTMIMMMIM